VVEPIRRRRLFSGQVHVKLRDTHHGPTFDVSIFSRLLMALLGLADPVMDIGVVPAPLDLYGDEISEFAGWKFFPDADIRVSGEFNSYPPASRIPDLQRALSLCHGFVRQ